MVRALAFTAGALGWLVLLSQGSSARGDLRDHYTDHLRHMGEAAALVEHGFDVYRRPYGEVTEGLPLPCELHRGLFAERTAPYPPLAILAHWPMVRAEQAGLAAARAHRLAPLWWSLLALVAIALWAAQLSGKGWAAWLGVLGLGAPLLLGAGANGFLDTGYLACGVAAAVLLGRGRPGWALVLVAGAGALQFRGLVFAPLGLAALHALWRTGVRRGVGPVAAAAVLLVPALAAAWVVAGTLGTIPADNPVHVSHPLRFWLLLGWTAAGALAVGWRDRPIFSATLVATAAVAVLERSYGYWHALALLAPLLACLAEPRTTRRDWALALAWVLGASVLAYREAATPFWSWAFEGRWQF